MSSPVPAKKRKSIFYSRGYVSSCVFDHLIIPVAMLSPTSSLQVSDQWTDILDTSLNVEVMPRRAGQTFTDMSDPRRLAITREGHLIVAEWSKHCITIIDPTNGRKIMSFGQLGSGRVQFSRPSGVAVTQDGRIVVAMTGYKYCQQRVPL